MVDEVACTGCYPAAIVPSIADVVDKDGIIIGTVCETCLKRPLKRGFSIQQRLMPEVVRKVAKVRSEALTPAKLEGYEKGVEDVLRILGEAIRDTLYPAKGNQPGDDLAVKTA